LLNLLAGGLIGVVSSLVAWWLGASGLAPRIEFGPRISKLVYDDPPRTAYRLKFKPRKRRLINSQAVDAEVSVRLLVTGLSRRAPTNQVAIQIPVRRSRIMVMTSNHIARLQLEVIEDTDMLPVEFARRIRSGAVTLEELLQLGDRAKLRVQISAADGLMRARAVSTHDYFLADITVGQFDRTGLDVVERDDEDSATSAAS
jgi:hypothetical protein